MINISLRFDGPSLPCYDDLEKKIISIYAHHRVKINFALKRLTGRHHSYWTFVIGTNQPHA